MSKERIRWKAMKNIKLNNGIEIPQLGLGVFQTPKGEDTVNAVKWALEAGYRHIDTAKVYGNEADVGQAILESKVPREEIFLTTKLWNDDIRAERTKEAFEESLKALKTDYVDVFLLHRPSPLMQADEIAEAVEKLKGEGKIIDFGLSNFTSSQTELIRQKTEVSYNQVQFSATHYEPMLDGSLDYMQTNEIRPLSWNPLGTVFREDTKQTRRLKKLFSTLLEKYHLGADTLLLAWILKHPAKVIPIAGTVNIARIQALSKAVELEMDTEDWFAIWTESMGDDVP